LPPPGANSPAGNAPITFGEKQRIYPLDELGGKTLSEAQVEESMIAVVLESLKGFSKKHLTDQVCLELDQGHDFPEEIVRKMLGPDLGLHLAFIPEEYGGFGAGVHDIFRLSEEMARIDLAVATAFLAISLGTDPILVGGTDAQKEKWLTRIADEGLIVAYGVTEPGAGSDLTRLKTKAERLPDGGYRLEGVKQFITNGGIASLFTILAMAPDGPTFFVVEGDREGLTRGKPEDKHGIRASNTSQVILEGVEVPAEHVIGGAEGLGLEQATEVFGYTRLMVAAFGLGGGEEALARGIDYARERTQFGSPLIDKPGLMHRLVVPAYVGLEAARAYIGDVATQLDAGGKDLAVEGAVAKLFATEAGNYAADVAIQVHGGYGYTREYVVEKIRRDVRITTIYEGTSEILRQVIARDRWRLNLQQRGAYYDGIADAAAQLSANGSDVVGGQRLARAARILSKVMETARIHRLTRNQSVLFRLADAMTYIEVGLAFSKAGLNGSQRQQNMARIHAREALRITVETAVAVVCGAGNLPKVEGLEGWEADCAGLEEDLAFVTAWLKDH